MLQLGGTFWKSPSSLSKITHVGYRDSDERKLRQPSCMRACPGAQGFQVLGCIKYYFISLVVVREKENNIIHTRNAMSRLYIHTKLGPETLSIVVS